MGLWMRAALAASMLAVMQGAPLSPAAAETGELRVAIQPGLTYLPFTLMEHGALIEKHARAAGLGDVKVTWFKVAGGDVMFWTGGLGAVRIPERAFAGTSERDAALAFARTQVTANKSAPSGAAPV